MVRKRKLPPPAASSVYELTEWGRELEPIVTKLGAWGARSPIPPSSREIGTDSIVLALGSLFDREAAGDLEASYELRIGAECFGVEIAGGELKLSRGAAADPSATIALPDAPTLAAILTGQLPFDEALAAGAAEIEGGKRVAKRFLRLFPMPEPCVRETEPAAPAQLS